MDALGTRTASTFSDNAVRLVPLPQILRQIRASDSSSRQIITIPPPRDEVDPRPGSRPAASLKAPGCLLPVGSIEALEDAILRGLHVFVLGPLAEDSVEARRLAMLADSMCVRLGVSQPFRYIPPVRDALTLLRQWAIGRVESICVDLFRDSTSTPIQDRGAELRHAAVYGCDLVRLLVGEISSGHGFVHGCDSLLSALFRNHDRVGAMLQVRCGQGPDQVRIFVEGSDGRLEITSWPWRLKARLGDGTRVDCRYRVRSLSHSLQTRCSGIDPHLARELTEFIRLIGRGTGEVATAWDVCHAMEMVDAIGRSSLLGQEAPFQRAIRRGRQVNTAFDGRLIA